jgi:hypothetical protein
VIVDGVCRPSPAPLPYEWQCLACGARFTAMSDVAAVQALNAHVAFAHQGPRPAVRGEDWSPREVGPC